MNALTRPYRVAVRPLHLESFDSYTTRLLTQNQEGPAQRQHLLRLARLDGATGPDTALWADIVEAKTGRHLPPAETTPESDTGSGRRSTSGALVRFLCTQCSNGDTVFQLPHFAMNVCLKHNRWVGPGTMPDTQLTVGSEVGSAERKFRKLRASHLLSPAQFESLRRCVQPLSDRMGASTIAECDAAVYPTVIRLATIISTARFSQEFFGPARSYASAYRYLAEQVAPYLPHTRRRVTRLLWLSFRSTFLSLREAYEGITRPQVGADDFTIHPKVASSMTRPIGPFESFAAYLAPTGDERLDARTGDRPDSYDRIKNICRMGHRLTKPLIRTCASSLTGTDNCRVCMHRELRPGTNDMGTTHPWLGAQLHPTKNGTITARDIFANSHIKLVWTCEKDKRHDFEATASNRAANGSGCSVCLNRVIIIGVNDLPTLFPRVARDWHPTKNGKLSVDAVAPGSNELVWWLCPGGHTYRMTVGTRTRGADCHYCAKKGDGARSLTVARPDLAAEMHRTKNGLLTPDDVTIGSRKDIVWRCPNDHDYTQRPERRNAGYGCSICSGRKLEAGVNDIQTRYPEISTEWHSWKNGAIEPCDLVPGNRKFWWKCTAAGHVHEQNVPHRVETGGCSLCAPADRIAYNVAR